MREIEKFRNIWTFEEFRNIWSRLCELTFSHFIKTNIFNVLHFQSRLFLLEIPVVWINQFGHVFKLDEWFCQIVFLFTFHPSIKKGAFRFSIKAWHLIASSKCIKNTVMLCKYITKHYTMLDLVLQAWSINWADHYSIPVSLLCLEVAELEHQSQSTVFL